MKKIVLSLSIILIILISGCISISYDSKVDKNGGIEKYNMTLDTNSFIYSLLNSGNQSLKDNITSRGGKYKEIWDGNNVKIIISGIPPENASVEKSENYFIYRDKIGHLGSVAQKNKTEKTDDIDKSFSNAMESPIKVHYYLEMPSKIIDSNADSVNDNKAEWHMLNLTSIRDVYAKCEVPSALPGVGLIGLVSILIITALILTGKVRKL